MFHHSGIVLEPAKRQASLDASRRRATVFTDTRPTSEVNCWRIRYFVLTEREARPYPDLTPVTSRRLALSPAFTLYRLVRRPMPPFPPEFDSIRFFYYYCMTFCSVYNLRH